MKKILFALAGLAISFSASAIAADQLRVYINPGHGSWTPNDRPMTTVTKGGYSRTNTDTTNFFESNTNLQKAFGVLESLRSYGLKFDPTLNQTGERWQIGAARDMSQNIVMSHVKCGPYHEDNGSATQLGDATPFDLDYYNRSLSEISAEVDANNFDMFISIHSNAATEGTNTNYPLFLYRGFDTPTGNQYITLEQQTISRAMAAACWPYWWENHHMQWTYYSATNMNLRGDNNFYGDAVGDGYLGALSHDCPGFLVEGYFHTYQAARHKAMNFDASFLEGVAYAHGIADYFELTKETTGYIYGVVRDKYEVFSHDYFKPNVNTDDRFLHLNGVKVTLKKDGAEVATYTTNDFYNGVFVFKNVEPGKYTLAFEHEQYLPLEEELEVEVTAANISYPTVSLQNKDWTPPAIVYENYPDPIPAGAVTPAGAYPFQQVYADVEIAELAGKTIRRAILRGENLYVLAVDEANAPTVLVYDTKNQAVLANVSTAGLVTVEATLLAISDIQVTADGVLVACSKARTHYGTDQATADGFAERGQVQFYQWANDDNGLPTGDPIAWFTSMGSANQYYGILGESMAYKGTTKEGIIQVSCENGAVDGTPRIWYTTMTVIENTYGGEANNRPDATGNYTTTGNQFQLYLSPVDEEEFIISGNNAENAMMDFKIACDAAGQDMVQSFLTSGILATGQVNNVGFFKYAGKIYMAAPVTAEGQNVGVQLVDVTTGLDQAKAVITTNTALAAAEIASVTANGATIAEVNELGELQSSHIALVLTRGNKISKFTTELPEAATVTPAAEGTANPYAYALTSTFAENVLTVNYSLNAAATSVNILIKDANNAIVASVAKGEQAAGAYTEAIDLVALGISSGSYTWEVEVDGADKTGFETFFGVNFWHPRGLDVDNNMESPAFGTVYVLEGMTNVPAEGYYSSGAGAGLYIFNPDMSPVMNGESVLFDLGYDKVSSPTYYADPSRVRVAEDGRIFITRSNDAGSYITVAANHAELVANDAVASLFGEYTFDAAAYTYTDAEGNFIGAANIGLDLRGSGEELQLAALSADNKAFGFNAGGSRVDVYDLGTEAVLPAPANVENLSGYMIAPQVSNVVFDPNSNGMWFTQYRATPSDTQPALVYVNEAGEQKYFEGEGGAPRGGGGMRFSPDGKQVAIASSASTFTIYDLLYDEEGGVTLIPNTVVKHGIGTNCYDIAWDLAGNIYICGNSGEWFKAIAMPRTEPFATKAASQYAFEYVKPMTTVTPVEGTANPFAYALTSEVADAALTINYSLNAAATNVTIYVLDAEGVAVHNVAKGEQAAGAYTETINLAELGLADGTYTWEVEVEGAVKETVETFFGANFWHPRGLDVDNNMESPAFGSVYVLEGMTNVPAEGYHSSGAGAGLYIFNADMSPVMNGESALFDLGFDKVSSPTYYADPSRIRIAEDGRIFITRSNDAGSYINVVANHEELVANDAVTSLFGEYTFDAATYTYADAEGNFIGAANIGFDVKGSGEELQLAALSADAQVFGFNAAGSRVDVYDLGTESVLPVPTNIENLSGYMIAPQVSNVAFDPNSNGMWFTQYRATPSDSQPALIYVNEAGEQKYFEGEGCAPRGGGGIRFTPDGKQLAIASSEKEFTLYDVVYNEDGTVNLYGDIAIVHGIGKNCYDIAFDLAGNVYICGNSGEWFKAFAMPRTEPFTTKAAAKYAVEYKAESGVEDVVVDGVELPVVYFNLQGIQVDAENLTPGIYVKVQGNKTSKVLVR